MGIVDVVEWVYDVVSNCVYNKGTIGEDAKLGGIVVEFQGQCNGC